ncbi:MAG: hypothetical protein KJ592_01360 [Nanoarchaeota archaeon]|nr:hypothetical protein [Nanoarchaeota archaeon]
MENLDNDCLFLYEKIPFLKKSREFFSSLDYEGINLWPLMAPEAYIYYENSEKDNFMKILSKLKYLFTQDIFKVPKTKKGKILATYFMPRTDHRELMIKMLKDFPKNEVLFLDYFDYKVNKSFLKYKFVFPDLLLLFQLWKKFGVFRRMGLGKEKVRHLFFRTYSRIKQIGEIKKIFDKTRPKAYISFCSPSFAEEAILDFFCKKEGVPTFTMQHGFLSNNSNNTIGFYVMCENFVSDYIFLWGGESKELLGQYVSEKRLLVVGNPKHNLKNGAIKFNPRIATFFFSVTPNEKSNGVALKVLKKFALKHKDIKINLKLHPFDDKENYKEFFDVENFCFVDKYYSPEKLLSGSDFVIVHNTSVAHEALLYRIPVFRFKDDHFADIWENDDTFENIDELEDFFEKLKDDEFFKKTMNFYDGIRKQYFYFPSGKSVSLGYYDAVMKVVNGK